MVARRGVVGAAFIAAGILAPSALPDATVPLPPLPQPVQGLLSPSASAPSSSAAGSSTAATSDKRASSGPSITAVPAFGRSILAAINRTRARYRLRALRQSPALTNAAVAHASALAETGQFDHSWPDGRPFPAWIRTFYSDRGYRSWSVGENLLWSTPEIDADTVVARWLASPEHRRNLLAPSWRELGLGVVAARAAPGAYGDQDVDVVAAEFGARTK